MEIHLDCDRLLSKPVIIKVADVAVTSRPGETSIQQNQRDHYEQN